jgi:hypothetical protein
VLLVRATAGLQSGLLKSVVCGFGGVIWPSVPVKSLKNTSDIQIKKYSLGVAWLFSPLKVRCSEARMPATNAGSDNKGASATARSTMG